MTLKDCLQGLLTKLGGRNYKKFEIDQLKDIVCSDIKKVEIKNPPEKALIMRLIKKVQSMKTAEEILTEITEKLFSLV